MIAFLRNSRTDVRDAHPDCFIYVHIRKSVGPSAAPATTMGEDVLRAHL